MKVDFQGKGLYLLSEDEFKSIVNGVWGIKNGLSSLIFAKMDMAEAEDMDMSVSVYCNLEEALHCLSVIMKNLEKLGENYVQIP